MKCFVRRGLKPGLLLLTLVISTALVDYHLRNLSEAGAAGGNLLINELDLNPAGSDAGNEWMELHNPTDGVIDMDGWELQTTHGKTVTLPLSGQLPPGAYLIVTYGAQWLDDESESVILRDPGKLVVDQTPFLSDTADDNWAWCRCTDSGPEWQFRSNTRGAPNICTDIPEVGIVYNLGIFPILLLFGKGSSIRDVSGRGPGHRIE
jgi:hypothetical protein